MKKIFTLAATIIVTATLCRAQNAAADSTATGEERKYTLKECMIYAVTHSADIKTEKANISDSRIERRDAILAAFTPNISAQAHIYSNFGRAIDPETNTYVSTTSFNNAYSVSAGFNLFNGFEAVNNLKITKTAQAMGLNQLRLAEDKICLATIEAYCNVLYYTRLVEILTTQTETAKETLKLTEKQEELGQKSYADLAQIKADLAKREYDKINAENKLNDAYTTLKDIMFWPADSSLTVETDIIWETYLPANGKTAEDINDIIKNAKNSIPDLQIAEGQMKNAKLQLRTAKWQMAPSLSLYGGWSTSYYTYPGQQGYVAAPFWNQFTNNGGEYVQLTLSIPIFNRLAGHSNIAKRKNELARREAEYEKTKRTIESEVIRAIQDRDGAKAAYLQAELSEQAQKEAYRINSRKFEQGLISTIEYKTASDAYISAQVEKINMMLQYYIKRRVVEYYNGTPYINQE